MKGERTLTYPINAVMSSAPKGEGLTILLATRMPMKTVGSTNRIPVRNRGSDLLSSTTTLQLFVD